MKPSTMFLNNDVKNREKFGLWLKTTRKEHDLSVRELAEKLGVSAAYISDIEKGNRNAPVNHLEKIAKIFNLTESELLYLADLAGCSRENWQDINDYLGEHKPARDAMRVAKNANLSDEEFFDIFIQTLDDAQRKALIDEVLYLAGDKEKDNCLAWISTKLTKEQMDAYNALSEPQEKQ